MKRNNPKSISLLFPVVISTSIFISTFITVSTNSIPVYADLSPERRAKISDNCGSLRNSLKLLQRSDSRARTYFGSIYETVSSKYLTPLNLRLVKNNLSSVDLINLQTSLATSRSNFSSDFISYSKSLEELISIDCHLNPEEFYTKLQETRKLRQAVAADMKAIHATLADSVKTVKELESSLDAPTQE